MATKKAAGNKVATKKVATKKLATRKVAAKKTPAKPVRKARPRQITAEQALANTRALLEAKQEHDRQPPPWQALAEPHGHVEAAGFQSAEAAQKAQELHAAESRMQAIQGSISTTDRHNQGKRDHR